MRLAIPPVRLTQPQFRAVLAESRLFNGPVSGARAGTLWGFTQELVRRPNSSTIPPILQTKILMEADLSPDEIENVGRHFKAMTARRRRTPDVPLTQSERSLFTDHLMKVLNLPWNAQIAGAFLAFADMPDEELPTPAAGLFPSFESFRKGSIQLAGWEYPVPLSSRYNNFPLYFYNVPHNDGYREMPVLRRFMSEEPELEQHLSQQITAAMKQHTMDLLLPTLEAKLYQAYQKMAGYVDALREPASDENPARVLIS